MQDADMKILITGGEGFIGANLALEIEKRFPSWQVTVLDNLKINVDSFIIASHDLRSEFFKKDC